MKKIYLLFVMITCFTAAIVAQPTITSAKFYSPGVSVTFNYADTLYSNSDPVNEGPAGANQIWDFAALIGNSQSYTNTYANASSTPYASSYPGANYAIISTTTGNPDPSYSYLTHTSSSTVFNGVTNDYNGTIVDFAYSDPQTFFTYPTTYNTSGNDTYAGNYSISVAGITSTTYHEGTSTSVADGYGTVITPTGTYNNCLRYKSVQHSRDSSVYIGIPIPGVVSTNDLISYNYISVTSTSIQEVLSISYNTTTSSSGTNSSKSVSYFTSITTGLSAEENKTDKKVNIYPNPVIDKTTITVADLKTGNASYSLYDVQGKLVKQDNIISGTINNEFEISMQEFRQGIYMLVISQDNNTWKNNIVKL